MPFVTKQRWDARGVTDESIDVADGQPRWRARVWGVPVEKRLSGNWPGTHRSLAAGKKGREFDLPNGRKLRWETSDSLAPFEEKPGELKGLAEFGAHVTSVVFAAAPPAGFTIAHKLSLGAGTVVAYQPELTQAEKDEGCVRPRAVVGSYAVYDKDGLTFMHIPCPVLVDAAGKKAWGTIKINPPVGPPTGVFNSVVTFKAADFAGLVYPVTAYGLDTFGYTTEAGTETSFALNTIVGFGPFSPGSSGSATDIRAFLKREGGAPMVAMEVTMGLYANNAGYPAALHRDGGGVNSMSSAAYGWIIDTLDSAYSVVGGTDYWLVHNHNLGVLYVKYNTVADFYSYHLGSVTYSSGALSSPFPGGAAERASRKYSIYCTYTPSAAGLKARIIGGGIL